MKRMLLPICWTLLLFTPPLPAADWSNWRGPWSTGFSPETNLPAKWSPDPKAPDNNLVWKAPYGCRSTPLVMNGRVFFINHLGEKATIQERVMCLDEKTGKFIWEHNFNVFHTSIVTSRLGWTVLAGDEETGNVYAHGTQGLFFCFNRDGKVLWSRSLSEEYGRISGYGGRVTSPVVVDDLVIIGMLNSAWGDQAMGGLRYYAMNKRTGEVIWTTQVGSRPKNTYYSVPVVAVIGGEKILLCGGASGEIHAVQVNTGKSLWDYYLGVGALNCSPVVRGNYVYIGHGEESPDTNRKGRIVCLDASQVKDGTPKLVWKKDGVKATYASPIIHDNQLIIPDEVGRLYCFDAENGKQLWRMTYGRVVRGSPVLADGKIYVGEVGSRFYILKPGKDSCEIIHEHFFPTTDGISDVEVNGSAAIANGRVFFSTSDNMYCIGKPGAGSAKVVETTPKIVKDGKPSWLQIVPGDVALHPGETQTLTARVFDAHGNFLEEVQPEWSLPTPPPPPGRKTGPPALKASFEKSPKGTSVMADKGIASQAGYVMAKFKGLTAKSRVRVVPAMPYTQNFDKIPDGGVPSGWVNTAGKFYVKQLKDGNHVLAKVNTKASPLFSRGNAYITLPTAKDYTIEADLMGTKKAGDMPDMGLVANRYTLVLSGNIQKLRLLSWDAIPRIDRTISFNWNPDTWYHCKLTTKINGDTATVYGKVWEKGQPEPKDWTITVDDPRPNPEGSAALYGYVTGILEGESGNDVYFDNVSITANKK